MHLTPIHSLISSSMASASGPIMHFCFGYLFLASLIANAIADESHGNQLPDDGNLTNRAIPSSNKQDVNFYLYYDKNNKEYADRLFLQDVRSVQTAHFQIGKPVIFITHGFMSGYDSPNTLVPLVKNAYLTSGYVNIIAVDWRPLASSGGPTAFLSYYFVVDKSVPIVGKVLCKMIRFLTKQKIITGPEMVHLVGHSLGSHVSGIAGHCVQTKMGGASVDRITGLDPAGPFFQYTKAESRLDAAHASFVDVLHTDIGMFGSDLKLGTVDFYANGGNGPAQPNCINFTLSNLDKTLGKGLTGICAHSRAYQYFARSILKTQPELVGCRCVTTNTFVLPSICLSPMNVCTDQTLYGEYVPRTAKGTFYVDVDKVFPAVGVESQPIPINNPTG